MPKCTMCEQDTPNEFDQHNNCIQPVGGLHVAIYPGYGMMTDPMDKPSLDALSSICLCHDCSIKFIDMFPQEFRYNFFMNGHPVEICKAQSHIHSDGCLYSWS